MATRGRGRFGWGVSLLALAGIVGSCATLGGSSREVAGPRLFSFPGDWAKIPADYDAVSWTCPVAADGSFRLEVGELRAGASQLRLRVCRTDGTSSQYAFDYQVDAQGTPDLASFLFRLPLAEAVEAYAAGDRRRAGYAGGRRGPGPNSGRSLGRRQRGDGHHGRDRMQSRRRRRRGRSGRRICRCNRRLGRRQWGLGGRVARRRDGSECVGRRRRGRNQLEAGFGLRVVGGDGCLVGVGSE